MRFVAFLFGVVFTLISLLEFLGGGFWLYRTLNVFAILAWWTACRKQRNVLPEEEELIELANFPELDEDVRPLPAV